MLPVAYSFSFYWGLLFYFRPRVPHGPQQNLCCKVEVPVEASTFSAGPPGLVETSWNFRRLY